MDAASYIPTARPVKRSGCGSVYVLYAICLLLLVTVGATLQVLSLPGGLAGTELFVVLLPAVLYVRRKRVPLAEGLRWRRVPAGLMLRGALLGCTGWGMAKIVAGISMLLLRQLGPNPTMKAITRDLPTSGAGFAVFVILATVMAGICEESLFRGAIQGTLERKGPRRAVIYTAILFAAFHLNPWEFVPILFLGVMFGLIVVRTGSLLPAMVAHACNNLLAFAGMKVLLAGGEDPANPSQATAMLLGLGVLFLAVLFVPVFLEFLGHTRTLRPRPSPLISVPARLSPVVKWTAGGLAATAAVVGAFVVTGFSRYTFCTASSDDLAPAIHRGETIMIRRSAYLGDGIVPGDIVAFEEDDQMTLGRVLQVNERFVLVQDGPVETTVLPSDVVGKVVRAGSRKIQPVEEDRGTPSPAEDD